MLNAVSLRHLHTLVTIARYQSMTDAAAALHCSLSTVSSHLALLERWMGTALLVRTARGWVPTQQGSATLVVAQEILERCGALSAVAVPTHAAPASRMPKSTL